ncbi:MAG: lytic transglycosylase domain-containing protein [Alphaproteobacteria bacterium]|nr:lytic transglycosylase domain-containing protein [Alphaproteobacteria bacterium]
MKYLAPIFAALMITAFSLAVANPAEASTRADVRRLVVEEAMNSHVPPSLAMAVAKVESDFQPQALSSAGARGVMQIMPATAMGEYGVGADELWDARLNVQLGIDFLEHLIGGYDGRWDLALSHYNGGSVKRTRSGMEPLAATRKYVEAVLKWQKRYAEQATVWALAEAPDEGWRPARTRRDEFSADAPRRIVVREITPETKVRRWRRSDETLDDFGDRLEKRVIEMRGTLDDFTPIVTWHDG